jgi:inorganic pyrophosphatase
MEFNAWATMVVVVVSVAVVHVEAVTPLNATGSTEAFVALFAVPRGSHAERDLSDVRQLSSAKREELEKFFIATDELEDKQLKIPGWKSPKVALKTVKKGIKAFQHQ